MVIAGTKGRIALGALSLTSFVTRSEAVVTEAMEALGQDSVLALNFAGWTRQRLFVLPDLLLENLIHVRCHFNLAKSFHFSFDQHQFFL